MHFGIIILMHLVVIFIAVFFFSLHFAATLYINSSFLEHFFTLKAVGALYIAGALGNILLFLKAPRLLNRLGARGFLFLFLFLTLGSTIGAAFAVSKIDAAILFIIYAGSAPMVYYALDLMLEERTRNSDTGQIRGIYLTLLNTAIAAGPLLITILGTDGKFKAFYIAAAVMLIPLFILVYFFLRMKHPRRVYDGHSLPFKLWWRKKAIRRVSFSRFVLEFFYAFMTIYTPIYLHTYIGFNWAEVGIILTIMLLPFIIFEWPAGELADKKYGEREIMALGFVIIGISMLFMPHIGKSIVLWTIALFSSRIGAAFIEITTESYFFKHVSADDSGLISIFRFGRSVGLIAGAIAGTATLALLPYNYIFYVLALASVLGFRESRRLIDTK